MTRMSITPLARSMTPESKESTRPASTVESPTFTRKKEIAEVPASPGAPVDARRGGTSTLSIHPTNIHPGLHAMRQDPRIKSKDLALTMSAVDRILNQEGIKHRFGGSLAAAINGAKRSPGDLDVEVANEVDVQAALQTLSHIDKDVKMGDSKVHIKGRLAERYGDFGGKVSLTITHPSGKKVETDVDVINENDPAMVNNLHSPQSMRVKIDPHRPNIVPEISLIVNYLDRLVRRPDYAMSKQDPRQIADLLNARGFDPHNPRDIDNLVQEVTAHVKPGNEAPYIQELHKVIGMMAKAGFGKK